MTTVTISRDFGSEGDIVARRIADELGYHFVDKEIIGDLLGNYGFVEFDKEYDSLLGFWEKFDAQRGKRRDLMVDMLNDVLKAIAVHGNVVILGRNGYSVLGGYADVFNIRFQAPFESRVNRLMREENLTYIEASNICEEGDKVRAGFVQGFYGIPWDSSRPFDLIINTDKIESEMALKFVVDVVKAYEITSKKGRPSTRILEVDSVLSKAVEEFLHCSISHTELTPATVLYL